MAVITINSRSSFEEVCAEMDRRGAVIEKLEASLEASEAKAARLRSVLRLCVDALNESAPVHNDYWAAAKAGEDALSSPDEQDHHDALESAEATVREARDVLGKLFRHAPDAGVDEFHDALRDAHLLMAKIDGAE